MQWAVAKYLGDINLGSQEILPVGEMEEVRLPEENSVLHRGSIMEELEMAELDI
jgi:hypothetical protein